MNQFLNEIFHSPFFWPLFALFAFLSLLFIVAICERRLTRPYKSFSSAAQDHPELMAEADSMPEYVRIKSDELFAAGFNFDQVLVHAKMPAIRVTATVWFSPERNVLAISGAGTVLKMPSWQTRLFTPLTDGRLIVTTDNNDEGDRSGIFIVKRVIAGTLPKLLAVHRARLEKFGSQTTIFSERSATDALLGIYQRHVDRMIQMGIVRYIDPPCAYWKYNAWGGLRMCMGFFVQLAQTFPQFWRVNRRPIGSHQQMPVGENPLKRYGRREGR